MLFNGSLLYERVKIEVEVTQAGIFLIFLGAILWMFVIIPYGLCLVSQNLRL